MGRREKCLVQAKYFSSDHSFNSFFHSFRWKLLEAPLIFTTISILLANHSKYSALTLEQCGFELRRSTCMQIFFNSKYYSTTWSMVGWSQGCRTLDSEELWILRVGYKLYSDFCRHRGSVPLTLMLFKGYGYIGYIYNWLYNHSSPPPLPPP